MSSRYGPRKVSLLVRNLPLDCRSDDVRAKFERFGDIRDVYLPRDYYTGRPKGFGFVEFRDCRDAEEALFHMDRSLLGGREISVVMSKESRKSPREMLRRDGPRYEYRQNKGHRRDRSVSRSRRRSYSRSYSRSRSPRSRSKSRSRSRSRSRSASYNKYNSRSKSRSRTPRSRSPRSRSRSRSATPLRRKNSQRDSYDKERDIRGSYRNGDSSRGRYEGDNGGYDSRYYR